jgi:hypothetical protein
VPAWIDPYALSLYHIEEMKLKEEPIEMPQGSSKFQNFSHNAIEKNYFV